jgi:hypothetical protein
MNEDASYGPYDAEASPPPLDFEAWAEISAELAGRAPEETDDVLDRRELDPRLWDAVNLFWLGELNRQVARGNLKLATRFGERCAEALRSREAAPAPPDDAEVDETAFMTALPDDTALPFASPLGPPAAPKSSDAPPIQPHPDTGETQQIDAVDEPELPFDDGSER